LGEKSQLGRCFRSEIISAVCAGSLLGIKEAQTFHEACCGCVFFVPAEVQVRGKAVELPKIRPNIFFGSKEEPGKLSQDIDSAFSLFFLGFRC
jgi:hypothetical protein